jgi:hypothetical protein
VRLSIVAVSRAAIDAEIRETKINVVARIVFINAFNEQIAAGCPLSAKPATISLR